jgi:hypothetical protein
MLGYGRIVKLVMVVLAALAALATVSCSGDQKRPGTANVQAGDMPEGSKWTGVYYSQTYGHLHLIEEGDTVSGRWRTTNGDAWGELAGEVNGDLLRYEWTEHKIGMVGPSASTKGRGYFKYKGSPNGIDPDEIIGEWGMGDEDAGYTWSAVKQKNMRPDPDSVAPDELERRGVGGGWDEGSGEQRGSSEGDKAFGIGGDEEEEEEEEEEEHEDEPPPTTGPDSEY